MITHGVVERGTAVLRTYDVERIWVSKQGGR